MDKLLLKPDKSENFLGWRQVNLPKLARTNALERDFKYLLSLLGIEGIVKEKIDGVLYLSVGDVDIKDLSCSEYETIIKITNNGIAIMGSSKDAISNGVKMLIGMKKNAPNDGEYPIGTFYYSAKIKMRAVHMCIFKPNDGTEKDDTDSTNLRRRLEKAALSGYNYVLLEFWGMFPYEKREYAHWPNCYSRETVEELISFIIDDLHMTAIPHQNLTSHAGWSRIISRQHVVLDQRPDLADMWIPGGWCFATTREDTKEYLKDIIDDLVKTFRNPPILHCSCDKCFGFGSTEEERVQPADDLFVNHLNFLHGELKKRGVRMAMWSDMLYSSLDVKYWKCAENTADRLPKDILMNIWTHNDIGDTEWKDISFFEDKGFETVYSPFLDKNGAKNMIKQCLKHKSLGIIQTTWHKPETALATVIYSGGYMWNAEEPNDDIVKAYLK